MRARTNFKFKQGHGQSILACEFRRRHSQSGRPEAPVMPLPGSPALH